MDRTDRGLHMKCGPNNRCFQGDGRGSVAVITGLLAFILVIVAGIAIDHNRALDLKGRLQNAADFAVLSALNPQNTPPNPKAAAEALFYSTLSEADAKLVTEAVADVQLDESGHPRKLTISFKANLQNAIMMIAGYTVTPVGGTASADVGSRYAGRFHFLVDTSDSMGLAATATGRALLKSNTDNNCELACHIDDRLALARSLNVTLRIDVARQGIERILQLAEDHQYQNSQFGFSIRSLSNAMRNVLTTTSDIAASREAARTLDIGYGYPGEAANSLFDVSLPQAATALDSGGVGRGPDYVVLITDGVNSMRNNGNQEDVVYVRLIEQKYCDMLKQNGRKVAVIYTEYYALPGDHMYDAYVSKFHDAIESNLRSCASSPDLFAKGHTPNEIIDGFEQIFRSSLTRMVHLSS